VSLKDIILSFTLWYKINQRQYMLLCSRST